MQVLALVSAAAMAVFASGVVEPWNGVLQRTAVTLTLSAEVLIAVRMLTLPRNAPPVEYAITAATEPSPPHPPASP